jgi:AraC-like DNA-binding protein
MSLPSADLALRGGLLALLLLIAGLLLREHARAIAARLGAAFAFGTCAYVICSAPALIAHPGRWQAPVVFLSGANSVLLWLLASALFNEEFRLRGWHLLLWAATGTLASVCFFQLFGHSSAEATLRACLLVATLGFAGLALLQTLSSWRADLLERRRRLRLFLVVSAALHLVISNASRLIPGADAPFWSTVSVLILFLITGIIVWQLSRTEIDDLLPGAEVPEPFPALTDAEDVYASPSVVAEIERAMKTEQIYREGNLTIGKLAARLGLLEYKLRRIINQGLGYRNFNTFLNHYRIEHAKTLLLERRHADKPVLTVAMDCGFQSLGPFNRAFKARTGMTPTEYRRAKPAHSKIG